MCSEGLCAASNKGPTQELEGIPTALNCGITYEKHVIRKHKKDCFKRHDVKLQRAKSQKEKTEKKKNKTQLSVHDQCLFFCFLPLPFKKSTFLSTQQCIPTASLVTSNYEAFVFYSTLLISIS